MLWSRTGRPKLNGPWTSPSTPTVGRPAIIRQTASAPTRRSLTLNDVFTLLLTPFLATALLADTSWKDKRRKDWAQRIAEIEAETEQIQLRAERTCYSLQSRSLRLGTAQQRRQYSVAVLNPQQEDDQDQPLQAIGYELVNVPIGEVDYEPEWFDATSKQMKSSGADSEYGGEDSGSCPADALEMSERLRRLLAIKLALNLTIYLNTGVSSSKIRRDIRIPDMGDDFKYDLYESQDLKGLLKRMKQLCTSVQQLKEALRNGAVPVKNEIMNTDFKQLQEKICALSERFQTGSIGMPEFISAYTYAVLKSPVWPTSKAYLALFRGFARGSSLGSPSHDLAMQTLFTWEQSKLPIGDHDLFVILSELARRKHVQKFDGLMRDLTMSPSCINVVGKWTWERAGDIQVPVPKSHHPAILTTLIHCALRFDQPQKAEAWSEILRRSWININDTTQKTPLSRLFTNWMRYYEVQGNWRKGVAWLDAAQKWAISVASFDMSSLQKLTVGMLSLCFACGKVREYEEILNAAIDSGIPGLNPEHFLEKSARRAICREWVTLHNAAYRNRRDPRTDQEKVQAFQTKVKLVPQRSIQGKNSADVEWRHQQKDKPNPMTADPSLHSSDQNAKENIDIWKQAYYQNQMLIQNSKVASEKWRLQSLKHHAEVKSLKGQLQVQKRLLQALQAALRPAELAQIETEAAVHRQPLARSQIEEYGTTPKITNRTLVSRTGLEQEMNEGTASKITDNFLLSRTFNSEQVNDEKIESSTTVDDHISLLSHLVKPEQVKGGESKTNHNSSSSIKASFQKGDFLRIPIEEDAHVSETETSYFERPVAPIRHVFSSDDREEIYSATL